MAKRVASGLLVALVSSALAGCSSSGSSSAGPTDTTSWGGAGGGESANASGTTGAGAGGAQAGGAVTGAAGQVGAGGVTYVTSGPTASGGSKSASGTSYSSPPAYGGTPGTTPSGATGVATGRGTGISTSTSISTSTAGTAVPAAGGRAATGGAMAYGGTAAGGTTAGSSSPVRSADAGVTSPDAAPVVKVANVNPFVITAHDPFSTFAADVDTASYDIFRQYALKNQLPPATGVRTEEYINYFSYQYPAPAADGPHPFYISVAAAAQVFDRPTTLVRVGIQATNPPPFSKKPTNLVFLLDVSGSMDDPVKLPLVKTMMLDALDAILEPTDTVAVVTYSTTATVRLTPTPVAQRDAIVKVISSLQAGGSTAGADGIGLAYQQATAGFIPGGINHIVMCTDGDFNVGVSSTADLLALIKQKRATGVTLTTLGFGSGNLNDAMMEAVSDAGNGIYSVIIDEDHALQYVKQKLLSTVVHVAKDMKIQVEFSPDSVYAYRLLGYEDRDIADSNFRNDTIDAGEVGAGHRVTALYEVVPVGGKIPSAIGTPTPDDGPASTLPREILPGDAVLVKVRYTPIDAANGTTAQEVSTAMPSTALTTSLEAADQDLRWATAVAGLAEILKQSPYASKSFLPSIRSICAAQANRDADRQEFTALLDKIVPLL